MPNAIPLFVLIVVDHDRREFSVEGPMSDDTQWNAAVVAAQKGGRQIICTNGGSDVAKAAADYTKEFSYRHVPPGSILKRSYV